MLLEQLEKLKNVICKNFRVSQCDAIPGKMKKYLRVSCNEKDLVELKFVLEKLKLSKECYMQKYPCIQKCSYSCKNKKMKKVCGAD